MMKQTLALLLLAAGMSTVQAGTTVSGASGKNLEAAVGPKDEGSIYDKIWGAATLYKDDNNSVLQELSLQGRLQLQWADGSSNSGDYGSGDRPSELRWGDLEVRRWRLGLKSKWFRVWKLEGQIDVNPTFEREPGANPDAVADGFYRDIYDLYLTYAPSDALNISVGKTKTNLFTLDQSTSSKEILTFERGLLDNALFAGQLTGVWVKGKSEGYIYAIGGFSGDDRREFTEFSAGAVIQASFGYDFASSFGTEKAIVRFDYQNSTDAGNAGGAAKYEHGFSLNSTIEQGRFAIYSEALGGLGRGTQGDVWGINLMPTYYIADSLQLVFRYQYAHGGKDALQLQSRYERLAPDLGSGKGKGTEYNAAYLGLNYYLYGHKLKLMTGLEYNSMTGGSKDFDGWTYLAGLRMFF